MRCGRCGKNFDEEMYSGICPKCGHFNNRQAEYDVSKYFSAKFDDGEKTSTSAQAAAHHEKLHKMYDNHNMHRQGAGQHEKLHKMYDKNNMHGSVRNSQAGTMWEKANPYQQSAAPGRGYQAGQTGSYQQNGYSQKGQYGQAAKLNGEKKEKNIVTPICFAAAALAIVIMLAAVIMKEHSLMEKYSTLDYEQENAEAGELFEISDRLLMVEKAEVIDTSGYDNLAVGEKLVAVTVQVLPADRTWERTEMSDMVYVSDGYSCKKYLDRYVVTDFLDDYDVLTGYDYLGYSSAEGTTGRFYFFVDDEADEITISFDEDRKEDTIFVLQKRVSVLLQLEEEGS